MTFETQTPIQPLPEAESSNDEGADARADGRRLRSVDSRRRIVAATIALMGEGQAAPTAEVVAARAQVSLRTVFRHFAEMDRLYLEIGAAMQDRVQPHLDSPPLSGSWPDIMDQMVAIRRNLYEELRPFKRALDVHSHSSAELRRQRLNLFDQHRTRLAATLPPAVTADETLVSLLLTLLSLETWDQLVSAQGLSPDAAAATIRRALDDLTAPVMQKAA